MRVLKHQIKCDNSTQKSFYTRLHIMREREKERDGGEGGVGWDQKKSGD